MKLLERRTDADNLWAVDTWELGPRDYVRFCFDAGVVKAVRGRRCILKAGAWVERYTVFDDASIQAPPFGRDGAHAYDWATFQAIRDDPLALWLEMLL